MIHVFTHCKSMQDYDLFCHFFCAGISGLISCNSKLDDSLSLPQIYRVSQKSCLAFICFSIYKRGLKILPIFKKYFQNSRWERLLSVGTKRCYFGRWLWNGACFGCESHLPPLGNNMLYLAFLLVSSFFLKRKRYIGTSGFTLKQRVSWSGTVLFCSVLCSVTLVSFFPWWHRREWQVRLAAQDSWAFSF